MVTVDHPCDHRIVERRYFDWKMTLLWVGAGLLDLSALALQPGRALDSRFYYSPLEAVSFLQNLFGIRKLAYVRTEFFDLAFIVF
jgi:hypothetical protein